MAGFAGRYFYASAASADPGLALNSGKRPGQDWTLLANSCLFQQWTPERQVWGIRDGQFPSTRGYSNRRTLNLLCWRSQQPVVEKIRNNLVTGRPTNRRPVRELVTLCFRRSGPDFRACFYIEQGYISLGPRALVG